MNRTVHHFKMEHDFDLPAQFQDDVRFSASLVEFYLNKFTNTGNLVFDPFLGFGTTLLVAEKMNRLGCGIEFDETRCHYVRSLLKNPDWVKQGDSRNLENMNLEPIDFCISSPPYMGKSHKENPFTAYTQNGDYSQYLQDIKNIYAQIAKLLKSEAKIVIEISNLKHQDGSLTTLAWDVAREVSEVLHFEGEEIIEWSPTYGYQYDHSYCLIFSL